MKLLIITQKVDMNDPILGFFHRWIIEFAKHCESIIVICLYEGEYELPANVKIFSLGKEKGESKIKYIFNFYKYIWNERSNYDKVFVHMNPMYIILGGMLWCLMNKRIALWYTHKSVDIKLLFAVFISNIVFTASKESFRVNTKKKCVVGHGIDTDLFFPDTKIMRNNTLLSVGRLMPTKRHNLVIEVAAQVKKPLSIVGDGPEEMNLKILANKLKVPVMFLGPLTQENLRNEYRKASFLIHTSETGSLDKVVLEALACGLNVISTSNSLSDLPITITSATPEAITNAILRNSNVNIKSHEFISKYHSLRQLIPKIIKIIQSI